MTRFTRLLGLALALWPAAALADLVADPSSPRLDAAFCPAGLPPVTNPIWNGELPAWSGASRPMAKITLGGNAICNDGSPAVIYVRPAPASLPNGAPNPLRDMYHIHLKGGGSCRTFEECRDRFCTTAGGVTDKPGLMSSLGYADLIEGTGLFADAPRNRFAYANQVLAAYCSSDTWIGSNPAGTAVSIDPADIDPANISAIAFMGEHIVNEMLDTLDTGPSVTFGTPARTYTMPALSASERLLVTGDSGGASGVRHHIDRMAGRYADTRVIAAIDAGGGVDMQDPRVDFSVMPGTPTYHDFMDLRAKQARMFFGVDDSALDASCIAAGDEIACFDGYRLGRDHIATEMLQRNSLADVTTVRGLTPLVAAPAGQTVRQLSYDGLFAAQAANPTLSVLGANCNTHITFRNNRQVTRMETLAGGPTLYNEIETWATTCFAGACPKMVTLAPPLVPGVSTCP